MSVGISKHWVRTITIALALLFAALCTITIVYLMTGQNEMPRLLACVKSGDISGVARCIEAGDDVNEGWYSAIGKHDDDLPLLEAIRLNHLEIASLLLEAGASPNKCDSIGTFPLHQAVHRRSTALMQMLIDKGATVDAYDPGTGTPLQLAIERRFMPEIVMLTTNGANVNLQDPNTQLSPLAHAVLYANGNAEVLRVLLDAGARPSERVGVKGITALEYAKTVRGMDPAGLALLQSATAP